ncbi:MAG: DNRLRE domain-containing protein [Bacteroidales bacterium]|nr:DNRLRE domain-containing protein [Bacteroidales bacterium]
MTGKAQTISSYSIDDGIVNQAYPDSVIDQSKLGGNLKIYRFRDADALKEVYSYVKFDISALKGFMVESAVLSYRGKTGDASFNDVFKMGIYAVNSDWKGDTLKYKTKPSTAGSRLDTTFLNASSARKDFLKNGTGLIDFINEEIKKGKSTISFAIKSFGKDTTDNMWIGGTTNGNYGPVLNCVISPSKGKYVIDDAVVMEAYPDSVIDQSKLGGNLKVFRKRDTGSTYYRTNSYIKFDISDLAGTQLESASISTGVKPVMPTITIFLK